MNVKQENNICRLCLKVAENDFEIIDEARREMFAVLMLRVNLDISKDPIICEDCANIARKCSNFKSAYIDTEKRVFSFSIEKKGATFEMKDVYNDEKDIETVDDNSICRFCSNHCGSNFVLLGTLMNNVTFVEMLQQLLPKMDFDIFKNPVICTNCKQDLECYIKFMENCLNVEEKITKYLQNEGIPFSAQINLSEILFQNVLKLDYTKKHVIKQEVILEDIGDAHSEEYDGELIKTEEIYIKNESYFNETACETPEFVYKCDMQSNMISSETKMGEANEAKYKDEVDKKTNQTLNPRNKCVGFKCATCTYETKYKASLKRHMLIHKDITELEMYKCSMCTYETKRKSNLKSHMIIHEDNIVVDMCKCSMCPYQTKQRTNLKRHMLIHTDIAEVEMRKCSICTFETKHRCSLETHMLMHKDITEVEIYKCAMCTFQTKHKRSLKSHMIIHKDVTEVEMSKCSICPYQTKQKTYLKQHILIHKDITEMKMYKCSMCPYQAKRKNYLTRHTLIHKDIVN